MFSISGLFAAAPIGLIGFVAMASAGGESGEEAPFPADYRYWTHVKSEVVMPGHKLADGILGIHHIYANDAALEGYETGVWLDGSIIVFDLFSYEQKDNALLEGERKRMDVMYRAREYSAGTGGWSYASFFEGENWPQRAAVNIANCHACHTSADGADSVFSEFRR